MKTEKLTPQFICMACKIVIGPIWDDDDDKCICADPYDHEVWRVVSDTCFKDLLEWAKKKKATETKHRPNTNIHKRMLIETWDQIIRKVNQCLLD